MTPDPFTFRLIAFNGDATDWIAYRHIDFRGRLMRVTLAAPYHFELHKGDDVSFETAMIKARVAFDSVREETLFLILPDDPWAGAGTFRAELRDAY